MATNSTTTKSKTIEEEQYEKLFKKMNIFEKNLSLETLQYDNFTNIEWKSKNVSKPLTLSILSDFSQIQIHKDLFLFLLSKL